MKSRIPTNDDLYKKATNVAARHVLSYCLRALEVKYGYRKDRLEKFIAAVSNVVKDSVDGNDMSSTETIQHMKEKYGIDLENLTVK